MCGLSKPKIGPGRDVAGEVAAVGRNVTRFKRGDAVFGTCLGAFAVIAKAHGADRVIDYTREGAPGRITSLGMLGLIVKPVIDRRYDLDDVARAVAYVEEGHANGKVAINVFAGDEA